MHTTLISVAELRNELGKDLVLLDCRFDLKDPDAGRTAYQAGHIPGAHYLDLNEDLSGKICPENGRHPLPGIAQIAETLRACGVQPSSQVVCYDASGGCYAARAWWLLKALGHESVAVLDGGFGQWQAAGLSVDRREPPAAQGKLKTPDSWLLPVIDHETLANNPPPDSILVDAREQPRYLGEIEPIDPIPGHIPGAINKPWLENIDQNGHYQETEFHRLRWQPYAGKQQIHYCGSGVTACVNILSNAIAGNDPPTLFTGSWSQWCHHHSDRVETTKP